MLNAKQFKFKPVLSAVLIVLVMGGFGINAALKNSTPKSTTQSSNLPPDSNMYLEKVQGVFNSRCIACHSCLESPCQLNLQSYEGLMRGLQKENVYGSPRLSPIAPTRLYEDAQSTEQWRKMGFHSVMGDTNHASLLTQSLLLASEPRLRPKKAVKDSRTCPTQDEASAPVIEKDLAMPYGLPSLTTTEQNYIYDWINKGAVPPKPSSPVTFSPEIRSQIGEWINFFNQPDLKHQITSRYLFEHLYLAHFFFQTPDQKSRPEFLKLIRSSRTCDNPQVISTRSPNDDPGYKQFYYCFVKAEGAIVSKNHIPYELSAKKLSWLNDNFIRSNWQPTAFPSYEDVKAANPFVTYKEMPIINRYKFLLEDSQYHVMTFIKGPVCVGPVAVNSIQDQFYVFFMEPQSDLMVRSKEYANAVETSLTLPGQFGSYISKRQVYSIYKELAQRRNAYRVVEKSELERLSPNGLALTDIWNGDETNDNALLTVFRHNDNASVLKGARGDLSKTFFVLDYSTFERLVYNLVVNFDIFGNAEHQILTRTYMDLIRMDSENNFINFLPYDQRNKVKGQWYLGRFLTKEKMKLLSEYNYPNTPTQIDFKGVDRTQEKLARMIIFDRLNEKVRGPVDSINWKNLKADVRNDDPIESQLRSVTSIKNGKDGFSEYFPDLSFLILGPIENPTKLYSIVHQKEHKNVSWMFLEGMGLEFAKHEDTLSIGQGAYGSYPNQLFFTESQNLSRLIEDLKRIDSKSKYEKFVKTYGVDRMDSRIWKLYDFANAEYLRLEPIHAGIIDLSRYNQ